MSELGIFPIVAISLASVTTAALFYRYLNPPISNNIRGWSFDDEGILKPISDVSQHSERYYENLIDKLPQHTGDSGSGRRRKYTNKNKNKNKNKNNRSGKRNK